MAQNFGYQVVSGEQGLSQNSVSVIEVDQQGYMWIGTQDGLNRFDGEQVINYQYLANDRKIHNIVVYDLAFDASQNVYILGDRAVERLSIAGDSSTLMQSLPSNHLFRQLVYHKQQQQILLKSPATPGFVPLTSLPILATRNDYSTMAYSEKTDVLYTTNKDSSIVRISNLAGVLNYEWNNDDPTRLLHIFELLDSTRVLCKIEVNQQQFLALALHTASELTVQARRPIGAISKVVDQASKQRFCAVTTKGDILLLDRSLALIKKISTYSPSFGDSPDLFITDVHVHQDHLWMGIDPFGMLYRSLGDNQFTILNVPQQPPAIIKNLFTDQQNRLFAFVLNRGLEVFNAEGDLITAALQLPKALR
ncbi:MAG: two-component regulator propeller domain-containing protein, partial [Bacteroidota bacterium]